MGIWHDESGWWFATWILWLSNTFHIFGIVIPTDELIFFRGVGLNHQPECDYLIIKYQKNEFLELNYTLYLTFNYDLYNYIMLYLTFNHRTWQHTLEIHQFKMASVVNGGFPPNCGHVDRKKNMIQNGILGIPLFSDPYKHFRLVDFRRAKGSKRWLNECWVKIKDFWGSTGFGAAPQFWFFSLCFSPSNCHRLGINHWSL